MTSRGSNEFVVRRESDRHETTAILNLPFDKLRSGGRVKTLDFTSFGYGEELAVRRPDDGSDDRPWRRFVLDDDEPVTSSTIEIWFRVKLAI